GFITSRMGSFHSKEDDVSKISTSIFVMNFPKNFSAKDLFHSCKVYGHVIDLFIPVKKTNGGNKELETESNPAIMLDDDCIMKKDLSLSLIERVKEFSSLANIKSVFNNEGFVDISIRFMGKLWIMLDFPNSNTRDVFKDSMWVTSWFSVLQQASIDFSTDGRIVWVEVEGVPFKLWTDNTFNKIAKKWGDLLDIDDQEDTCYHSKRLCIFTKMRSNVFETFKVIFRRKVFWIRAKEVPG
nr:UvrD-like helicase, ATP-binding domain, P-loop containing nucleoside triphosphate hydrolase [Tanacetum cinerariifolium]